MSKDDEKVQEMAALRRKAEKQLNKKIVRLREKASGDLERVLHELEVHQIELEMQNDELLRAQQQLEASRHKYADLYDFAPIGYFTFDTHGHVTEANLTGCKMLGVERKNLINKPFHSFVARDSQDGFHKHRWAALNPGQQQTCEITLVSRDGHRFEARLDSVPVLNDGQHVIGARMAVIDITERKQAGAALRESEERYRTFFEGSLDAVLLSRPDDSVEEANAAACEMFQMSVEELRKAGRSGIVDRSDPRIARFLEERAQAGRYRGELNFRRKDGTVFPGEISSTVFTGVGGVARTAMIIRDITERKKAEEAMRREAQILAQVHDCVVTTDLQGNITLWNRGAERVFGYSADEALGQNISLVYFNEDLPILSDDIIAPMLEWSENELEVRCRHKSGREVFLHLSLSVLRDENGSLIELIGYSLDITERKKAEEALRRSEQRLKLAQISAGAGVWGWDITAGKLEWSEELFDLFGLDPAKHEASFETWRSILHPDDKLGAEERIERAIKTHAPHKSEYRILLESGRVRWISSLGDTIYDDQGKPQRMSGICLDVTERKKAEEAMRREAQILAQVHDCVVTTDLQGNITLWNRGAERLFGYSADEALGQNISLVYFDEDLPILSDAIIAPMLERSENELEVRCRHKSGREVFLHLSLSVLRDENGSLTELIGYSLDVTERKKAEEALRESEEKFRLLAETSPAAILIYQDGQYVYVNPAAESISGYTHAELLAQAPGDMVEPDYHEQVEQMLSRREQREEPPVHYELEIFTKDGQSRWMDCWTALIRYGNKPAGLVLAFDVTERKRAEQALIESEQMFRNISELNPFGAWESRPDGGAVYLSQSWLDKVGMTLEQCKKFGWMERYYPGEGEKMLKAWKRCLEAGERWEYEHHLIDKNRKDFWVLSRGFPLRDREGRITKWVGLNIDITEHKQAEKELFETNQRLDALMCALPVGVSFSTDATCRQITGNPAVLSQFEVAPQDNLSASAPYENDPGRQVKYFTKGRQISDKELPLQRAVNEQREIPPTELEIVLPSGKRWFAFASAAPIYDEEGNVIAGVAVTVDITERKRTEQQIKRDVDTLTRMHELSTRILGTEGLESILQNIMDTSVAIMKADKGTLQLLEGQTLRIVAHHGHEKTFVDFFSEAENQASVCGEALKKGRREVVEDIEDSPLFKGTPSLEVLRKAGIRSVQSTPLSNRRGGLLGILTTQWGVKHAPDEDDLRRIDLLCRQAADLIENKKAEQALRQSNAELSRFNRVAVGRELRMIELKKEVNELCSRAGLPAHYPLDFEKENINEEKQTRDA